MRSKLVRYGLIAFWALILLPMSLIALVASVMSLVDGSLGDAILMLAVFSPAIALSIYIPLRLFRSRSSPKTTQTVPGSPDKSPEVYSDIPTTVYMDKVFEWLSVADLNEYGGALPELPGLIGGEELLAVTPARVTMQNGLLLLTSDSLSFLSNRSKDKYALDDISSVESKDDKMVVKSGWKILTYSLKGDGNQAPFLKAVRIAVDEVLVAKREVVMNKSAVLAEVESSKDTERKESCLGYCKFCGEKAGFMRSQHGECRDVNEAGMTEMKSVTLQSVWNEDKRATLADDLARIAARSFVPVVDLHKYKMEGFEVAVEQALSDDLFSEEENDKLTSYDLLLYEETGKALPRSYWIDHYEAASKLYSIMSGDESETMWREKFGSNVEFNLQKTEEMYAHALGATLLKDKVRRERVGGSRGVSVRVAGGMYVHAGGTKSRTVETDVREEVDWGRVGVTDRHVYFSGEEKSFRVQLDRIVSIDTERTGSGNGFRIVRDAVTANPQIFMFDNEGGSEYGEATGFFYANFISWLSRR